VATILKLGGSVITRKEEPETVDDAALRTVAEAVGTAVGDGADELVLVHGAGSFGHYHADRHGVTTTAGTRDAAAVREVHDAMTALSAVVCRELGARGVPVVPVRPLSAATRDDAGRLSLSTGAVRTMLEEGFVPVLHGDLVAHEGEGATVLSGDEVVVALAADLDADRLGLCSAVPGVLDENRAVIDRIDEFERAAAALGGSDATDVSGGMGAKVRTLLDCPVPASVFGLDDLADFLASGRPGTTVGYEG
jgi:isopentenyl phosphate kinase